MSKIVHKFNWERVGPKEKRAVRSCDGQPTSSLKDSYRWDRVTCEKCKHKRNFPHRKDWRSQMNEETRERVLAALDACSRKLENMTQEEFDAWVESVIQARNAKKERDPR